MRGTQLLSLRACKIRWLLKANTLRTGVTTLRQSVAGANEERILSLNGNAYLTLEVLRATQSLPAQAPQSPPLSPHPTPPLLPDPSPSISLSIK